MVTHNYILKSSLEIKCCCEICPTDSIRTLVHPFRRDFPLAQYVHAIGTFQIVTYSLNLKKHTKSEFQRNHTHGLIC